MEVTAAKQIVSDTCRSNHGNNIACQMAINELEMAYAKLQETWPVGKDAKFIFTLTVSYPDAAMSDTDKKE